MKTSRETYHRIRWDPRFDPRDFVIGYEDRRVGMREMPLLDFKPDGDIPWHRVWIFRQGDTVVWDRRAKTDALSAGEAPPAPQDQNPKAKSPKKSRKKRPMGRFVPIEPYRYDTRSTRWVPSARAHFKATGRRTLRVATLNVLVDHYKPERIQTARRTPTMLALLHELDADIIGLQEVTQPFLEALMDTPWVQRDYTMSDSPEGRTIRHYGQLILSRVPVQALWRCDYSPQKRVIVADITVGRVEAAVAVVHLTSNYRQHNTAKRARQLRLLLDHLDTREHQTGIILGDFNCENDHEEMRLTRHRGFMDTWALLQPDDPGYTFDPTDNALACETSTSGHRRRYDRILLRTPGARVWPRRSALFAREPLPRTPEHPQVVFPSDHFGLFGDFDLHPEPPDALALDSEARSALVLLPPPEAQAQIQAIRARHDRHAARWMPHINLLYGFVPEEALDEAARCLTDAMRCTAPFEMTLSDFDHFDHRESATAWLSPHTQPGDRLLSLQSALQAIFPQCEGQSQRGEAGYTPHLTLGQFADAQAAEEAIGSWRRRWRKLRFEVSEIHIISRRGDDPFEIRHTIPLAGQTQADDEPPLQTLLRRQGAWPEPRDEAHRRNCLDALRTLIQDHPPAIIAAAGSHRIGIDLPDSDLDLVCAMPAGTTREAAFELLRPHLTEALSPKRTLLAADALAPVLKLDLPHLQVDLQIALFPEDLAPCPPEALASEDLDRFAPASRAAIVGCIEIDAIALAARDSVGSHRFQLLARAIKHWASSRRIDTAAYGFLGGISWALLSAWVCQRHGAGLGPEGLIERFFTALVDWDWSEPIALHNPPESWRPHPRKDRMPILAPSTITENTARHVTRSTRRVLDREFARALDRIRNNDFEGLFTPLDPTEGTDLLWHLSVSASDPATLMQGQGWLRGHALGLIIALEQHADLEVRPIPPRQPDEALHFAMRGAGASDRAFVEATIEDFAAQLDGKGLASVGLVWGVE